MQKINKLTNDTLMNITLKKKKKNQHFSDNCHSFLLENCNITNNTCNNFSSLFYTTGCRNITMKSCTFRNNTYPSFGDKEEYNIIDCLIEDENYDEPVYYDVDPEYEVNF